LQFKALRVREFADGGRNGFPSGNLRGAITPRSGYKLKNSIFAARQRTDEDGLQDAMLTDVASKFREPRFVERASWIGFRFLNAIEWNFPKGGQRGRNGIARVHCDCGIHFRFLLFSFFDSFGVGSFGCSNHSGGAENRGAAVGTRAVRFDFAAFVT
jgi:hypothetical protein